MVDGGGEGDTLPAAELETLVSSGRRRQVPHDTVLFWEGDPGHDVIVIESGAIKLTKNSAQGRQLVVAVRSAGELVGDLAAIDDRPRSTSATAVGDCGLAFVPVDAFRALMRERATLCMALLQNLTGRLRESTDQAMEFCSQDAMARVCRRLIEAADQQNEAGGDSADRIVLPYSQQEMADRSGLSREAVVKAIRSLKTLGWIDGEGRAVAVLDEAAIRERAAE